MRLRILPLAAFLASIGAAAPSAQPAPSFQARCGELRGAMAGLQGREERELITIEVVGTLEMVREESGLALLGLCGPPHPRVLCITYQTNDRQVGDHVVVVGSIHPAGEDFIQLDPCLHYPPTPEDRAEDKD